MGKELIMRSSGKYKKLMFLTILVFVIAPHALAISESDDKNAKEQKEILTVVEQKMQKKVSIDFRDTPIEDVIRILAEQGNVDIIKSPKVTGAVTATFTNVPLEEALNNILAAQGYGYVATKNIIRIVPVNEVGEATEVLVSKIYRITYANTTDVEKALQKFLSKRGSLSSNPGTSNIIVTDTESKIKAIDTFINEVDRITPQILVEARIYDITGKDKLDLGIKWEAGRNTTYSTTAGLTGIGTNPTAGEDNPFITGAFKSAVAKSTGTSVLRFGWLNSSIDIDALLSANQNITNAKLLANPRVLVLDNQTAIIKIISEIPYQELTETSAGGSMGSTSFKEVGVELEVVPHVTRDEMVRLQLKPKFSVKTDEVQSLGTSTGAYSVPVIDKREADTTLLIKSGQTVVLGGLRKKDVTKQTDKIPFLGDLPLVGALFRFKGESTINSELVVFVTPWIINQPTLSETEQQQYKVTEFSGPQPDFTGAEKSNK